VTSVGEAEAEFEMEKEQEVENQLGSKVAKPDLK